MQIIKTNNNKYCFYDEVTHNIPAWNHVSVKSEAVCESSRQQKNTVHGMINKQTMPCTDKQTTSAKSIALTISDGIGMKLVCFSVISIWCHLLMNCSCHWNKQIKNRVTVFRAVFRSAVRCFQRSAICLCTLSFMSFMITSLGPSIKYIFAQHHPKRIQLCDEAICHIIARQGREVRKSFASVRYIERCASSI